MIKIRIKRPKGQVVPSSKEIITGIVKDAIKEFLQEGKGVKPAKETAIGSLKRGEPKTFNNYQKGSKEEYVVEELKVKLTGYTQGESLTKDGVIALFDAISKYAETNKYYVGITCDPNRREGEHNAEFLAVIACPNKDKANDMERTLSGEGYDAGGAVGNVHNSDSKKVYIYKKSPKTVE